LTWVNAQYVVNKLVYILWWVRFELFRILSNILGQWYRNQCVIC